MLQQQQEESAAEVRVSPLELAQAMTSLEVRKAAERKWREETISLGEAVEQLDLELTPEQILAEIEATPQPVLPVTQSVQKRRLLLTRGERWLCSLVGLSLFGNFLLFAHLVAAHRPVNANSWHGPVNASSWQATRQNPFAPGRHIPFSQVPDEITAYASLAALRALANGIPTAQVTVLSKENNLNFPSADELRDFPWRITKFNGKPFVSVFTSSPPHVAAGKGRYTVASEPILKLDLVKDNVWHYSNTGEGLWIPVKYFKSVQGSPVKIGYGANADVSGAGIYGGEGVSMKQIE